MDKEFYQFALKTMQEKLKEWDNTKFFKKRIAPSRQFIVRQIKRYTILLRDMEAEECMNLQ